MTDQPASQPEPEPDPVPPGLDELIEWLKARTPAAQQAKFTQRVIDRLETEVRDPALQYAWDHRREGATTKDLMRITGVPQTRILLALGKHPRSDV